MEQTETPEQLELRRKEKGSKDKVGENHLFPFQIASSFFPLLILEAYIMQNLYFIYLVSCCACDFLFFFPLLFFIGSSTVCYP